MAGRVVGIGLVLGGAYSLRREDWKSVAGTLGAAAVGYEVINAVTGEVVPFLPEAPAMLQPRLPLARWWPGNAWRSFVKKNNCACRTCWLT